MISRHAGHFGISSKFRHSVAARISEPYVAAIEGGRLRVSKATAIRIDQSHIGRGSAANRTTQQQLGDHRGGVVSHPEKLSIECYPPTSAPRHRVGRTYRVAAA